MKKSFEWNGMTVWDLVKKIFFIEILIGLRTTIRHLLFAKEVTFQYPHEKRVLPEGYRGMICLLRYDDGSEKCVGCDLCGAACPSHCITVVSGEVPGMPGKRWAQEYYLDVTRCVFCGFCVAACPVSALASSPEYEFAVLNKRDLILDKERLLQLGDRHFPVREPKPPYLDKMLATLGRVKDTGYPAKKTS